MPAGRPGILVACIPSSSGWIPSMPSTLGWIPAAARAAIVCASRLPVPPSRPDCCSIACDTALRSIPSEMDKWPCYFWAAVFNEKDHTWLAAVQGDYDVTIIVYLHKNPVYPGPWNIICYTIINVDHSSSSMIKGNCREKQLTLQWRGVIWPFIRVTIQRTLGPAYNEFGYNEQPSVMSRFLWIKLIDCNVRKLSYNEHPLIASSFFCIFTTSQRSCGKVLFSQACVCSRKGTGGGGWLVPSTYPSPI